AALSSLGIDGTTPDALGKLREALRAEQNLIVIFGAELQDSGIHQLIAALPNARFICLGDYANSRGASDMGLYPGLLPGYHSVGNTSFFHEEWGIPQAAGLNTFEMVKTAQSGKLKALYVVGSNP